MPVQKPIKITETVLRDAHQSLIATRMPTELMLPIVDKMDKVGYHSVECWGGATFDACLRFLKEDPWDRLRKLRDGDDVVGGAVARALGIRHLKEEHAVDRELSVVARNADLTRRIERDFLEGVAVCDPIDERDDEVEAGREHGVELA